jgi:cytochrome c-type biogenesis protein CcmH
MVETRIAAAEAQLAGKPATGVDKALGEVEPSAADIAAAQDMSPGERQAMIERMVEGLANRLDHDGDDLPGWLKLVRAYSVLDRKNEALKALERARSQFSNNTQALEQLDQLAEELGLKS